MKTREMKKQARKEIEDVVCRYQDCDRFDKLTNKEIKESLASLRRSLKSFVRYATREELEGYAFDRLVSQIVESW